MYSSQVKKIIVFCILILLIGCVSNTYVPPTEGSTAMMTFELPDINGPVNTMSVFIYKDPYKCLQPQSVDFQNKPPVPFKIKTGGLFTFTVLSNMVFKGSSTLYTCDKTFSFYPQPNEFYSTQVVVDEKTKNCNFTLYQILKDSSDAKSNLPLNPVSKRGSVVRKMGINLLTNQKVCVDKIAGDNLLLKIYGYSS